MNDAIDNVQIVQKIVLASSIILFLNLGMFN